MTTNVLTRPKRYAEGSRDGYEQARGRKARALILMELQRREAERELPPTFEDLADVTGLSESSARNHVALLVEAGLVKRRPHSARSMQLTDDGREEATAA
jgi:DNA-binding MarR family transcriptional regulator